jgi:hypothetical protein
MNIHHRKPRQMGGSRMAWLNEPENLLMLCGSGTTGCHGWIESHRTDGYHFGWLLRTGSLPHLTPFCDLYGNWNLLIGHDKLRINMPCGELPKPEYQTSH